MTGFGTATGLVQTSIDLDVDLDDCYDRCKLAKLEENDVNIASRSSKPSWLGSPDLRKLCGSKMETKSNWKR